MSVLNVFKTSVDTINASSITSDMTIGANLNGGSLTLGAAGATNLFLRGSEVKINEAGGGTVFIGNPTSGTTDINSKITNIGTTGLPGTGKVNIATGTNATGSEINIGALSLPNCYIRGNAISIADNGGEVFIAGGGLAANKRIRIGNGANGAETELHLGSSSLSRMYIRGGDVNINHVANGNINMGTINYTTSIVGNVTLGADSLTNPTAASTNITLGTANSIFRLYTPITISYSGINYNMNTIGGTYSYISYYNLSFPSATRAVYGCTPILPIGVYALSGFINFGGVGQGTIGFINLVTANSTLSNGATNGFNSVDDTVFYGSGTWPGPGNGATQANVSDIYILTSSKCLALAVYITQPSNAGQASCKFTVIRIG